MKILLLTIGNTDKKYMKEGLDDYVKRLSFYMSFEMKVIPDIKNRNSLTEELQKEKEGQLILNQVSSGDFLILLDERGTEFSSIEFSKWIEKKMISGIRQIVFVIGGPYGFSNTVYQRSDFKISLSKMTFSHQMVRIIFVEQIYRAMTIIKNEPYHHE
ncbi:MAG: 23S rRNA (pseudouridine(1915)-N(3))-methyltransferase RlmH [Bacteroidia bacterium]|nr:23S rRNA (pseudouridine(1915)-N(3))-methyltransferase RlmH [Bacteroidia bacterium]